MTTASKLKTRVGTRELVVSLNSDTKFKDIVRYLEKTLVVPEIPGISGCDPCLSGLERIVLEDTIINQFR